MYKKGDLILVNFPFSDLSSSKVRPAIVIGNYKKDYIILAISSNRKNGINQEILDFNLSEGKILIQSFIKINKIISIENSIIFKKIGKVKNDFLEEIKKLFIEDILK